VFRAESAGISRPIVGDERALECARLNRRGAVSERLAIYTGPESCGVVRKDNVEALTGESAGRVFSRETYTLRNADAFRVGGRHHQMRRYREAFPSSARSQTPSTHPKHLAREPGDPALSHSENCLGRIGKSKDVRR
jgi:hypothetical protein